jgi:hypothetical protein
LLWKWTQRNIVLFSDPEYVPHDEQREIRRQNPSAKKLLEEGKMRGGNMAKATSAVQLLLEELPPESSLRQKLQESRDAEPSVNTISRRSIFVMIR